METLSNDVTAYIVTNVISITDGQIYLDQKLFTGGQRPAVNIGLSVSRVGSSAQNKAMKKVGGALKMLMGEYRKMAGEQTSGAASTSPVMIRGARCLQLFNQKGMPPALGFFLHRGALGPICHVHDTPPGDGMVSCCVRVWTGWRLVAGGFCMCV